MQAVLNSRVCERALMEAGRGQSILALKMIDSLRKLCNHPR
jgi:hypothetical protein